MRPSKELTKVRHIKPYLNSVSITKDCLLIVTHEQAFTATKERIVVPRDVFDGLITALHIELKHPSAHQLKSVTRRYFFALDMDKAIERISATCQQCASVKKLLHVEVEQTSGDLPSTVGRSFTVDIMRSSSQYVLVIRDCIKSYTNAMLVS